MAASFKPQRHMTRLCSWQGGGYLLAVHGGIPWYPAATQLQLVCGPIITDRYDLSEGDVCAMQEEIDGG